MNTCLCPSPCDDSGAIKQLKCQDSIEILGGDSLTCSGQCWSACSCNGSGTIEGISGIELTPPEEYEVDDEKVSTSKESGKEDDKSNNGNAYAYGNDKEKD